jgi:hypothetical protein
VKLAGLIGLASAGAIAVAGVIALGLLLVMVRVGG